MGKLQYVLCILLVLAGTKTTLGQNYATDICRTLPKSRRH